MAESKNLKFDAIICDIFGLFSISETIKCQERML
jgi:hypothetical protein